MIERCLWAESLPRVTVTSSPPPDRTDVAVIGSGYTGLSAARVLARRGAHVTVL